jgi:lysophospholipase L1-like esterase
MYKGYLYMHKFRRVPYGILPVIIVAVCIVSVGAYFLVKAHAQSSFVSAVAEAGTIKAPAISVTDSTASAGSAVKFVAATPSPTSTPTVPVRLMPLGDSITDGHGVLGGYRTLLWQELVQTDHDNIDFVGSLSTGPTTLGDKDNEGHSGWCIDGSCYGVSTTDLVSGIDGWLATYKPDIILLHAGTNDLGSGDTGAVTATHLDTLLEKIFTDEPNAIVIVAQIISMNQGAAPPAEEAAYNADIPALITKYKAQGRKIEIVDMSGLLTSTADYQAGDFWHPSQQGYDKMANAWYPLASAAYKTF